MTAEGSSVWAPKQTNGTGKWVAVHEVDQSRVCITIDGFSAYLTPDGARILARQLYRHARRIDAASPKKET